MDSADLILVFCAVQGGIRGGARGVLRESWSGVGLVGGLVVSVWASPQFAVTMQRWFTIPVPVALGGMFCGVFGLTSAAAGLVGLWLPVPVGRVARFGSRIGGVALGIAKGLVVGAILLVGIDVFQIAPAGEALVRDSGVAKALVGRVKALLRVEVAADAKPSAVQAGS